MHMVGTQDQDVLSADLLAELVPLIIHHIERRGKSNIAQNQYTLVKRCCSRRPVAQSIRLEKMFTIRCQDCNNSVRVYASTVRFNLRHKSDLLVTRDDRELAQDWN